MAKTGDKNLGKIKGFSIQFLPYSEIRDLSSNERIRKILDRMRGELIKVLSKGDLGSMTIIGPATIVKEIKRNPKKIELLLSK